MSYPVDVTIYLNEVKDLVCDDGSHNAINEDYGIENFPAFDQALLDEIALVSLSNYNEAGTPRITEDQFLHCIEKAVVSYYISELIDEGVVEPVIDFNTMQIGYQLTQEGRAKAAVIDNLLSNINLN